MSGLDRALPPRECFWTGPANPLPQVIYRKLVVSSYFCKPIGSFPASECADAGSGVEPDSGQPIVNGCATTLPAAFRSSIVDCSEVLEQLSEFLDSDAQAELCRAIEQHLSRCPDCSVYVDSVKKTVVLYQADRDVAIPVKVSAGLQAALARAYNDPPQDAAARAKASRL